MVRDELGEFLRQYDEYLTGKRRYEDLPVLGATTAPECSCDERFRTAEDYRDHLPCVPSARRALRLVPEAARYREQLLSIRRQLLDRHVVGQDRFLDRLTAANILAGIERALTGDR